VIFFKPKTINIDLFTFNSGVYEYAKPDLAKNFYPDWWKKLSKQTYNSEFGPGPTIKTCAGFIDLYRYGFMFPMWCDVFIRVEDNCEFTWRYADQNSSGMSHSPLQAGSLFFESNVRNFKLISPWVAQTKEEVYWSINQPLWSQGLQKDFIVPPAVLNFKHQNTANINTLITDISRKREFIIPFRMPLVHYIPIDERPCKLHLHLVSEEEYNKINDRNRPVSFSNSYKKKIGVNNE
jgi:hypothetical protein